MKKSRLLENIDQEAINEFHQLLKGTFYTEQTNEFHQLLKGTFYTEQTNSLRKVFSCQIHLTEY